MYIAEVVHGGLSAIDLQKAVENEFEMALQDRVMEASKDRNNVVEYDVYDMKNKVHTIIVVLPIDVG